MSGTKSKVAGASKSLHYDSASIYHSSFPHSSMTPQLLQPQPLNGLNPQPRKQPSSEISSDGQIPSTQSQIKPSQSTTNQISSIKDKSEFFKVFVRVRPINAREKSQTQVKKRLEVTRVTADSVILLDPEVQRISEVPASKSFTFDGVFNEKDDNQSVYNSTVLRLLQESLLEGYNATVFAYGQTGAGKTYTLFGDEYKSGQFVEGRDMMSTGIISLTINDLFSILKLNPSYSFSVKASYLEIYNESIRDLLVDQNQQAPLMIVEDPSKGVVVPDLSEFVIQDSQELTELIRKGNNLRVMANTQSNQYSSRSHGIIQIMIEKTGIDESGGALKIVSRLSLIDLAGSERAAVSDNKGIRFMEGSKINRSLLALGNCINILSDPRKQGAYVPYRDSKLTRLLKDSLGGNTQTVMIACIGPSYLTYEESLNTLKYAQRAKRIKNEAKQNRIPIELPKESEYKKIINQLRDEIESLKLQITPQQREQRERDSQHLNVIDISKNLNGNDMDDLSSRIFLNIEENWEISQTLSDLENLRQKNEITLQLRRNEENSPVDQLQNAIEITALEQTMQSNAVIFLEMQENLAKNLSEKSALRQLVRDLIEKSGGAEKSLEETCRLLQLEKLDLYSQNFQIKQEAQSLAMEKQRTETRLKQMERQMLEMQKKLSEKDDIISKSTQIIDKLKLKEISSTDQLSKSKKKTTQNFTLSNSSPKFIKKSLPQSQQLQQLTNVLESSSSNQKYKQSAQSSIQRDSSTRFSTTRPTTHHSTLNPSLTKSTSKQPKKTQVTPGNQTESSTLQNRFEHDFAAFQQPEVKKEYFYFDSKKNLVKRDQQPQQQQQQQPTANSQHRSNDSSQSLTKNKLQSHNQDQQSIPSANELSRSSHTNKIQMDLNSLKKFEEIQQQRKIKEESNGIDNEISAKKVNNGKGPDTNSKLAQAKKRGRKGASPNRKGVSQNGTQAEMIQQLKNYANQLQGIDFQNVKIKPDLKKFKKNEEFLENKPLAVQLQLHNTHYHHQPNKLSTQLDPTFHLSNEPSYKQSSNKNNSNNPSSIKNQNLETPHGSPIPRFSDNKTEKKGKSHTHFSDKTASSMLQSLDRNSMNKVKGNSEKSNAFNREDPSKIVQVKQWIVSAEKLNSEDKQKQNKHSERIEEIRTRAATAAVEGILSRTQQSNNNTNTNNNINLLDDLTMTNEISLLQRLDGISPDETLRDFIDRFQEIEEDKINTNNFINHNHNVQSDHNGVSPARLNLKSLDEARQKIRVFKLAVSKMQDDLRGSGPIPIEKIAAMELLLEQQQLEKYSLTLNEQASLSEFQRLISMFKKSDDSKQFKLTSNLAYNLPPPIQQQQQQSYLQQYAKQQTLSSENAVQTGLNFELQSTNIFGDSTHISNIYYQQPSLQQQQQQQKSEKNSSALANRKSQQFQSFNQQQQYSIPSSGTTNNNSNGNANNNFSSGFHSQNNISVNKKNIEQGAFSKIVNNYGEAAKVINNTSSSSTNQSRRNLKSSTTTMSTNANSITAGGPSAFVETMMDSHRRISSYKRTDNGFPSSTSNQGSHSTKEEKSQDKQIPGDGLLFEPNADRKNKIDQDNMVQQQLIYQQSSPPSEVLDLYGNLANVTTGGSGNPTVSKGVPFANPVNHFLQNSSSSNSNTNNNNIHSSNFNNPSSNVSTNNLSSSYCNSTAKPKSSTSYMSINSKRKSFKEENYRNGNTTQTNNHYQNQNVKQELITKPLSQQQTRNPMVPEFTSNLTSPPDHQPSSTNASNIFI